MVGSIGQGAIPRRCGSTLFSFISQNWRGKPLVSYQTIVQLIAATTTETGLTVRCERDTASYPGGISVSDAQMNQINIIHGEWNYTVAPNRQQDRALAP